MRPAPRKWYASMRFGTYSTLTRAFLNICIHLLSLHAQHHRARCACTYIINTALALSSTPRILFIMRRISLAKSLFRQQHVHPQLSRSTHYTDLHTARHSPPRSSAPSPSITHHLRRVPPLYPGELPLQYPVGPSDQTSNPPKYNPKPAIYQPANTLGHGRDPVLRLFASKQHAVPLLQHVPATPHMRAYTPHIRAYTPH
jgi:hypothetical protein